MPDRVTRNAKHVGPDGSCSASRTRFWQRITPRLAGTLRAAKARASSRFVGDAHVSSSNRGKHLPQSPVRRIARVPRDLAIVASDLPGSVPRSQTVDAGEGSSLLLWTERGPRNLES
jgi:hypothetical protein